MRKNERDKFVTFLRESGADVLETTNEYEVVRFRTVNGVSIIYRGKRGMTFTGESREAYEIFKEENIWQIKRRKHKEREQLIGKIRERDGLECFYCGEETVPGETSSIEHILSIAHGGNNNPANLTIACRNCNYVAGSMTVLEKVKYRETVHKDLKEKSDV